MPGMHDAVSELWIMRRGRNSLDITGYIEDVEAIEALIRVALAYGPADTRARIEAAVARGLTHLDEGDAAPT